ncbi:MAG: branched-chain amino acid ABC transporter permease [Flavonifractor sp.]|jgi:Na+/H+ antiporter NhaD/arsenite permease-like protein|nr:branched-chain amino acid ABC transporter permease [Flavonifractor sp.]MCI9425720.1 branched-chain amino acid ABC transporter permease [Flavonifractor sp.]
MEVVINADRLIALAELVTALGVIGGVVLWCIKFVQRSKRQHEELKAIRREQTLICYGLLACLQGLKEQGCNGPVTEAMNRIEEHLNQAAHDEES